MDELDDITDEERLLAAQLAERIEGGRHDFPPEAEELAAPLALLRASGHLELRAAVQQTGRALVLARAAQAAGHKRREKPRFRWWAWVPLPALGVLVFAFVVRLSPQAESKDFVRPPLAASERADPGQRPEKPSGDRAPWDDAEPWHRGEAEGALLAAQAAALAGRARGHAREKAASQSALDAQMRDYRTQLLARMEVEP